MSIELRPLIFRVIIFLVIFGLQFLLYRRTIRWLQTRKKEGSRLGPLVQAVFLLFNITAIYAAIWHPVPADFPSWILYLGVYPYMVWHGATLFIGLIVLMASVVKLPFRFGWWGWKKFRPDHASAMTNSTMVSRLSRSRRTFLRRGMYGLTAVSFGGTAIGFAREKSSCDLNEQSFEIADLAPEFDGFSIGLLTDIHSGMFMERDDMESFVQKANSLKPDMFIVGGDFVNSQVREVFPFAEAFSGLTAPHGVFGVLGNHDFYTGNPEAVAREVEGCGIALLRDESLLINRSGSKVVLGGIDDVNGESEARRRMIAAFAGTPQDVPRLLISHRPYFLPAASKEKVDLMLSGHTHGGQVVLGRIGQTVVAPASLASRYVWGVYRYGKTSMYVSRGIGTVGLPIRINCPPEITRIVLRRADSRQGSQEPG